MLAHGVGESSLDRPLTANDENLIRANLSDGLDLREHHPSAYWSKDLVTVVEGDPTMPARFLCNYAFVGRPIRNFFDLRGEIIRRMAQFANVRLPWKERRDDPDKLEAMEPKLSAKEEARLNEAQEMLRDLASQMRSFALNEALAVRLLKYSYDPFEASARLFGLANRFDRYGESKLAMSRAIEKALRFKNVQS